MDVLRFAIDRELEGEKYYKEQAASNRENSLYSVFIGLANDESNHARILEAKSNGFPCQLNMPVQSSAQGVFDGIVNFQLDTQRNPEQVDVYHLALEQEKQSIELYQKLLRESKEDKDVYEFLILQEKEHYKIMEQIVKMVNRPNEWVESAEFGIREEY